jgi:Abortive infection C-terminus
MAIGLTGPEIYSVVNDYIGVDGGYLSDFSYRSHQEFYPYFCGLEIDPLKLPGTTRERFLHILRDCQPSDQAKILRGVLAKCPPNDDNRRRTPARAKAIEEIAVRLESGGAVRSAQPRITSEVVQRAINDAETLIATNGATSGVDRVHTALHGYLKVVLDEARISYSADPSITDLFKLMREKHLKFRSRGPRAADLDQVLKTMSAIIAALNPVRNRASVAHPNDELLEEPEAMLVINAVRTILQYIDAKLG